MHRGINNSSSVFHYTHTLNSKTFWTKLHTTFWYSIHVCILACYNSRTVEPIFFIFCIGGDLLKCVNTCQAGLKLDNNSGHITCRHTSFSGYLTCNLLKIYWSKKFMNQSCREKWNTFHTLCTFYIKCYGFQNNSVKVRDCTWSATLCIVFITSLYDEMFLEV